MRQDIIDFYATNQTPVPSLVTAGAKRGLTEGAVLAAAETLYEELQAGLEVKSIRLAWEVFTRAKNITAEVNQKEINQQAELKTVINDLRDFMAEARPVLDFYRQPWWKQLFRRPV